jgi:hypothetical protein
VTKESKLRKSRKKKARESKWKWQVKETRSENRSPQKWDSREEGRLVAVQRLTGVSFDGRPKNTLIYLGPLNAYLFSHILFPHPVSASWPLPLPSSIPRCLKPNRSKILVPGSQPQSTVSQGFASEPSALSSYAFSICLTFFFVLFCFMLVCLDFFFLRQGLPI